MKWPFTRNSNKSKVAPEMPPELSSYYQAEKRQQTAVTWLLGFATLAVTIALAFALFLGVRWVIKKVRNQPASTPTTTQEETATDESGVTQAPTPTPESSSTNTPAALPAGETNSAQTQTPQTSSATTNLPSTGPAETIAVFTLVTVAGTVLHRVTRRRQFDV